MRNLEELKQQGRILLDEKRDEFVKQGLLSDEFFEMIQKNKKPMDLLMSYYQCASMEIETKFRVLNQEYSLEYGTAVIEMHKTSIKPGQKVLIVDDLIATGGTTQAMISLVERLGGEVAGVLVLIELAGLKGREAIAGYRLDSAIVYEGK